MLSRCTILLGERQDVADKERLQVCHERIHAHSGRRHSRSLYHSDSCQKRRRPTSHRDTADSLLWHWHENEQNVHASIVQYDGPCPQPTNDHLFRSVHLQLPSSFSPPKYPALFVRHKAREDQRGQYKVR